MTKISCNETAGAPFTPQNGVAVRHEDRRSHRKAFPMRKFPLSLVAMTAAIGMFAGGACAAPNDARGDASAQQQRENMQGVLLDARIAGMKAALKLTPQQEKNWAPFEAAIRDGAKLRAEVTGKMREEMRAADTTPIARLDDWSNALSQGAAGIKKVADAARPLYDSLDAAQKRDFGPLLATLRPHQDRWAAMERHMRMHEGAEHVAK